MMDVQCRWLDAVVTGQIQLPSEQKMVKAYTTEHQRLTSIYPSTPRYELQLDPREYGFGLREDVQNIRKA
jgi:hypothetical protein